MIAELALQLRLMMRPADVVGHAGDGVFLVLLPYTTAQNAARWARTVLAAVSRDDGLHPDTDERLGVSAGMAMLGSGRLAADEVLQRKLYSLPNATVHVNAQTTELTGDGSKLPSATTCAKFGFFPNPQLGGVFRITEGLQAVMASSAPPEPAAPPKPAPEFDPMNSWDDDEPNDATRVVALPAEMLAALGERDIERRRGLDGIVEEQLVEVTHPVEDQMVRMHGLDRQILAHHRRGVGGNGGTVRHETPPRPV